MWKVEDRKTNSTQCFCTRNIDAQLFPYAINRPAPPFVQGELVAIIPCLEDAENVARLIAEAPAMYMLLQNIYDEWPQDRTGVVRLKELKALLDKLKGGEIVESNRTN